MQRNIKHVGVGLKSVLCAVAVVDVPVDDEDSVEAVDQLKVAGGDCDIVE